MQLDIYQVDAFSHHPFGGNPAAVCPLTEWLPDEQLQQIAAENNLSETAFFVQEGGKFRLRWFTPGGEVRLCGHATLASAYVLFEVMGCGSAKVVFSTLSGDLTVSAGANGLIEMDFPAQLPAQCAEPAGLAEALGIKPVGVLKNDDIFAVFGSEDELLDMRPDFELLRRIDTRGVCVTAPGARSDFSSRFFAPRYGINEDPVTGSSHCGLIPFWAKRLGKTRLLARQVSARGGTLHCAALGERVKMAGHAVMFMKAFINLPL